MLVGSKVHSENEEREVSRERAEKVADMYQLSAFREISSTNGQEVEQIFDSLTKLILKAGKFIYSLKKIYIHPTLKKMLLSYFSNIEIS